MLLFALLHILTSKCCLCAGADSTGGSTAFSGLL